MTELKAGQTTKIGDRYHEVRILQMDLPCGKTHEEYLDKFVDVTVPRTILRSDLMHLHFYRYGL